MAAFLKSIVTAVFLLMLALPGLEMITGAISIPPLDENRNKAPFPVFSTLSEPSTYVDALHAWFLDHYGFRDLLIRAKTQLDFSLFNTSDRLHIGKKGFLFYRSVIDTSELQVEALTDQDLDRALQTFAGLRDWLAPRGIHLIIQTEQMKDKFYPEYLPREAKFASRRHRFDDFRAKLSALPGVTYLDTTPQLMALKQIRPIYHRTDFHWNDPAAAAAGARLVDTIATLEGRPTPFWKPVLHIVSRPLSGGQALFMPLFHPPSEISLFVEPTWDDNAFPRDVKVAPFEWKSFASKPDPHTLLPTTVVFGDSFVDGMVRAGLVTHFNAMLYARLYQAPFDEVMRALPPDTKYLVVEFVEISLLSWINMKLAN